MTKNISREEAEANIIDAQGHANETEIDAELIRVNGSVTTTAAEQREAELEAEAAAETATQTTKLGVTMEDRVLRSINGWRGYKILGAYSDGVIITVKLEDEEGTSVDTAWPTLL